MWWSSDTIYSVRRRYFLSSCSFIVFFLVVFILLGRQWTFPKSRASHFGLSHLATALVFPCTFRILVRINHCVLEPNMCESKVPLEYLFLWRIEVLVILVIDTCSNCQCLDLLLSIVMDNGFTSFKVVVWVVPDVQPISRLGLLPTCLVLLQFYIYISIMLITTVRYKGTLVSFWCVDALW